MRVIVLKEPFTVAKVKKPIEKAFALIQDKREITAIIESSKLEPSIVIEAEDGWRVLTFDAVLPFNLVGFLARISSALAEENISILAISSFSTDHILVKAEILDKALKKLKALGFTIEPEG